MSAFERYLTLWVFLCIVTGIALGQFFPAVFEAIGRMRLKAMPGEVLKLIARDAGAPEDLPAYCRMTGHKLLLVEPDTCTYWIEARQSRAP